MRHGLCEVGRPVGREIPFCDGSTDPICRIASEGELLVRVLVGMEVPVGRTYLEGPEEEVAEGGSARERCQGGWRAREERRKSIGGIGVGKGRVGDKVLCALGRKEVPRRQCGERSGNIGLGGGGEGTERRVAGEGAQLSVMGRDS